MLPDGVGVGDIVVVVEVDVVEGAVVSAWLVIVCSNNNESKILLLIIGRLHNSGRQKSFILNSFHKLCIP